MITGDIISIRVDTLKIYGGLHSGISATDQIEIFNLIAGTEYLNSGKWQPLSVNCYVRLIIPVDVAVDERAVSVAGLERD